MKILITGSKGFIGQNMVLALKDEHDVHTFDWGDTYPILKGFDWVIHLGAISSTTETNVEKVMIQNYDFSRWLLRQCNFWNVNFQYASSASVYGLVSDFKETSRLSPQSPYAWSKYLFDRHVATMDWGKLRVQGFRYFNVYGPYEDHKGDQASPYHKFTKQAIETGVIKIFEGSENFKRDFVPVETVVNVHKRFFTVHESGLWNVGTGVAKSFKELAEEIAQKYNATIEYIPMPDNIAKQYQKYTCADLTKLRNYFTP